jgi:heat shock protein HslJ
MKYLFQIVLVLAIVCGASSCTLKTSDIITQDNTILDAYWMLVSLEGQKVTLASDSKTAFIRFQEKEDDIHGFTGCNKFKGKYNLGDDSLILTEISSTKMSCTNIESDQRFLEVLQKVDSYRISKNVLTLFSKDKAVATFMTGNPDTLDNDAGRN